MYLILHVMGMDITLNKDTTVQIIDADKVPGGIYKIYEPADLRALADALGYDVLGGGA